jgi:CRP-like cAMP-binding protein
MAVETQPLQGFELTQTRKAWAAELGLTHEALYRTLRRLAEQGAIAVDGTRICLLGVG